MCQRNNQNIRNGKRDKKEVKELGNVKTGKQMAKENTLGAWSKIILGDVSRVPKNTEEEKNR